VLKVEDGLAVAVKDWICSTVAAAGSMKPGSLTIYADNGGTMICEPVTRQRADLYIETVASTAAASAILLVPVHFGTAPQIRAGRPLALASVCAVHPERFVSSALTPPLPGPAWINKPKEESVQIIR
jgi:hypothetical protein